MASARCVVEEPSVLQPIVTDAVQAGLLLCGGRWQTHVATVDPAQAQTGYVNLCCGMLDPDGRAWCERCVTCWRKLLEDCGSSGYFRKY